MNSQGFFMRAMHLNAKPVKQKGAAMVELAIVLPVLLIITFGIVELGRALYQHNALGKGADSAARYMSRAWGTVDIDCNTLDPWSASVVVAKNLAAFGNEAGTGNSLVKGLSATDITIAVDAATGFTPTVCVISVESAVTFQGVFGDRIVPFLDLGPINLSTEREMRFIGE
jgi:Flp pilus assembly protein TadG